MNLKKLCLFILICALFGMFLPGCSLKFLNGPFDYSEKPSETINVEKIDEMLKEYEESIEQEKETQEDSVSSSNELNEITEQEMNSDPKDPIDYQKKETEIRSELLQAAKNTLVKIKNSKQWCSMASDFYLLQYNNIWVCSFPSEFINEESPIPILWNRKVDDYTIKDDTNSIFQLTDDAIINSAELFFKEISNLHWEKDFTDSISEKNPEAFSFFKETPKQPDISDLYNHDNFLLLDADEEESIINQFKENAQNTILFHPDYIIEPKVYVLQDSCTDEYTFFIIDKEGYLRYTNNTFYIFLEDLNKK